MRTAGPAATWGTGRSSVATALACLGLALPLVACDGNPPRQPDGSQEPGCPSAAVPVEPNPFDGRAAWFVVDSLRLGAAEFWGSSPAEGFDLDCTFTRPGDPYMPEDGPGGADNQFGSLMHALVDSGLEVDVDGDMQRAIEGGRVLLAFRLADVDDWSDDGGLVYLSVYNAIDADADPANNFTGDARLLVDARSLLDPTDASSARTWFLDGVLRDSPEADEQLRVGDFTASGADVFLDIAAGESVVPLAIRDARVVWDLASAPSGEPPLHGRLVGGLLGGAVLLGEAVQFVQAAYPTIDGSTIDPAAVRSIAAGQADMDTIPEGYTAVPCTEAGVVGDCGPGQICEADPSRADATFCFELDNNPDAISVAFVFTAVSIDFAGITHPALPP